MSLSDYMYRNLTKGSIAKGLIWFALAGRSVRSVSGLLSRSAGVSRILQTADTISAAERRFCRGIEEKGVFL